MCCEEGGSCFLVALVQHRQLLPYVCTKKHMGLIKRSIGPCRVTFSHVKDSIMNKNALKIGNMIKRRELCGAGRCRSLHPSPSKLGASKSNYWRLLVISARDFNENIFGVTVSVLHAAPLSTWSCWCPLSFCREKSVSCLLLLSAQPGWKASDTLACLCLETNCCSCYWTRSMRCKVSCCRQAWVSTQGRSLS